MALIKLLHTPKGVFIYDAITNSIAKISSENLLYDNLTDFNTETIRNVLGRQYSPEEKIEISPPLNYESLKYLIQHNCSQLVLSVTEQCNMRCHYCAYHDRYDVDIPPKLMSLTVAKKAIEIFIKNSIGLSEIIISFYGGEPLLRFELIKECVLYARKLSLGQHIKFHITTNGLLLNDEIVKYLEENRFVVSVSIDGPRFLHDRYRVSINNKGTYDIVINNLKEIYFRHTEFFCNNFIFMPVYAPPKNDELFYEFFEKSPIDYIPGSLYVTPHFRKILEVQDSVHEILLNAKEKLQYSKFARRNSDALYKYTAMYNKNMSVDKAFPAGNCIPGCRKVFCNASGNFYLCEKVSETKENCIGDITKGIDASKVYYQYERIKNKYNRLGCESCWAIHYCSVCFRDCNDIKENQCEDIRKRVEKEMIASIMEQSI